jgi:hypothetical protein
LLFKLFGVCSKNARSEIGNSSSKPADSTSPDSALTTPRQTDSVTVQPSPTVDDVLSIGETRLRSRSVTKAPQSFSVLESITESHEHTDHDSPLQSRSPNATATTMTSKADNFPPPPPPVSRSLTRKELMVPPLPIAPIIAVPLQAVPPSPIAFTSPTTAPQQSTVSAVVPFSPRMDTSFAEHSATTDALSTSLSVKRLAKSVSFSIMNQTIDADNTIRKSSVAVVVVPPKVPIDERESDSEEELPKKTLARSPAVPFSVPLTRLDGKEANENNCANGEPIEAVVEPAKTDDTSDMVTASNTIFNRIHGSIGGGPLALSSSATVSMSVQQGRAGANPSLHMEIANLALSVSQSTAGRVMSASMKHSGTRASSLVTQSIVSASSATPFEGERDSQQQELTEKAVIVIRRVLDKLTGLDFPVAANDVMALEVKDQVDRLIREATSNENLSQSFFGWCPFW